MVRTRACQVTGDDSKQRKLNKIEKIEERRQRAKPVEVLVERTQRGNELSDYEQQRLANIQKNKELLETLGVASSIASVVKAEDTENKPPVAKRAPRLRAPRHTKVPSRPKRLTRRARAAALARGETLDGSLGTVPAEDSKLEEGLEDDTPGLQTCEEYFKDIELQKEPIRVKGYYEGWISEEVQKQFGIGSSSTECWESQGGGKFSFKNIAGDGIKINMRSKPSGWSSIKFVSSKLLKKNPNAYFYRHCAPGVQQWNGNWSDEEVDLFCTTARKYGAGDKWGLFATHIPHRVGYQCANFYRQVILPSGLIFDPTYNLNGRGEAVYVGRNQKVKE
eukprot:Clim_evm121s157 gene=Clim_evmTU121s157